MSGRVLLSLIGLVLALLAFAYLGARNEIEKTERLAEVAARAETGREIDVRCPGPIAERFDRPLLEGRVDFNADGTPKPYTKMSPTACKGLRVLTQRLTVLDFACLERGGCTRQEDQAALGVAVLSHELMHLRGVTDEAVTECLARKRLPEVARALGLSESEIVAVSRYQVQVLGPRLGPQYQGGRC